MTTRVRFAPSPTGYLHIGGARTAIYNYLFAKATNGTFILRVEDTDQERSSKEYENSQIQDLKWLGINHDEGPDLPGEYGPYRQSERLEIYREYSQKLLKENKAYYCFCSQEELEEKKNKAIEQNLPPHYDGTCRDLSEEEVKERFESGIKPIVRFRTPQKFYRFKDLVRKKVKFPQDMVGDFIIMRSDNYPVYNFCCVVDDMLMKITHVIRAEDHLNNTLRQLMLYEAFETQPPEFAHVSLLIGKDRQKLSKRHGATSVTQYRDDSYLPEAMNNYLCLLGWSHPDEKEVFKLEELKSLFDAKRFNKAPAVFDVDKFRYINSMHIKQFDTDQLHELTLDQFQDDSVYKLQTVEWQKNYINLYKGYINFFKELPSFQDDLFSSKIINDDEFNEMIKLDTTKKIYDYLFEELEKVENTFLDSEFIQNTMNYLKKDLGIKGKPLFMGLRLVLTGRTQGPELKTVLSLIPVEIMKERFIEYKKLF